MPLRDYYNANGKYLAINGHGAIDAIFDDIAAGLEKKTGAVRKKK